MVEMLGSVRPRRLRRTAERYLALTGALALGLTLMMASSASAAGQEPADELVNEIVAAELLAADAGPDTTAELPRYFVRSPEPGRMKGEAASRTRHDCCPLS